MTFQETRAYVMIHPSYHPSDAPLFLERTATHTNTHHIYLNNKLAIISKANATRMSHGRVEIVRILFANYCRLVLGRL